MLFLASYIWLSLEAFFATAIDVMQNKYAALVYIDNHIMSGGGELSNQIFVMFDITNPHNV